MNLADHIPSLLILILALCGLMSLAAVETED